MKYQFPIINTIDDVLPAIEGRDEFIVIKKDDYTVVDYVLQSSATFPAVDSNTYSFSEIKEKAILRECRGLIFDKQGKLISRPFHKFFNYGEKSDEQANLGEHDSILKKLDGSMIRPIVIDGDIRLATRKGITDVAMQAETFAAGKDNYINFISGLYNGGFTPIFEWCSRNNQIVLTYSEENLILLAVRKNDTGVYMPYAQLSEIAKGFSIPYVESMPLANLEAAVKVSKGLTDEEGYVIVYPDGHRMKVKSDWYVTLHKAKEAIGREKDLIKAYLTTGIDDILPILPEDYKQKVCSFLAKLTEELVKACQHLDFVFSKIVEKMPDSFTRKEFALEVLKLHPKYKPFMFSLLPGIPCMEIVIPVLIKACSNNKALQEYRWLIGGIRFDADKTDEKEII